MGDSLSKAIRLGSCRCELVSLMSFSVELLSCLVKNVNIIFRFDELKELFTNRKTQLEDSLALYQFFYDLDMEMAWIREHMTLANSEDLGTSLIGVQRLQKRHLVRTLH